MPEYRESAMDSSVPSFGDWECLRSYDPRNTTPPHCMLDEDPVSDLDECDPFDHGYCFD